MALRRRLCGFAISSTHPRPLRLFQGTRGVDCSFHWYHLLYQRCELEAIIGDRLNPNSIRYADPSVNWSKYSKPWDVIFEYPGRGIVQFMVGRLPRDIPQEIPQGERSELHTCRPQHVPLPENYSHSEIWTYKPSGRIKGRSLGALAKKEFRQILSDRGVILHKPTR